MTDTRALNRLERAANALRPVRITILFHTKNFRKDMAIIIVNGEDQEVQLPATVADIIQQNNVAQPEMVSVQVNEEFVDRDEFATLQLQAGDEVDFLYFMGGGGTF